MVFPQGFPISPKPVCNAVCGLYVSDEPDLSVSIPDQIVCHRITSYSVDMEQMAEACVKSLIKKMKHRKYVEGARLREDSL